MSQTTSGPTAGGSGAGAQPAPAREFTLKSAFALSFSDISPIVGIYSVFAICIVAAGPAFFWALPVVLVGQLLVTGVFGELVSKWPLQGSVYAWSRELIGPRYGWVTMWAYSWGLTLVLSALAIAASGYLLGALGVDSPSHTTVILVALVILILASLANMVGGSLLKSLLYISTTAELIASVGIGIALLLFHRTNSWSELFSGEGTAHGSHWLTGPFLLCIAFVGFSFLGFESSGSIAEEVQESRKVLPKAITLSLAAAGVLVMFASLGLVLAIPNIPDVVAGNVGDPIASTLKTRLGSGIGRVILIMLTIGFSASLIAVQAAVSRGIWAGARDRVLPGYSILGRLSGREGLPRFAIGLTAIIAGPLMFISTSKVYTLLLSFGNAGFYISFTMPVVAVAYLRLKGLWRPGDFSMGSWGAPVTYVAAVWIVLETINIAWPRDLYGTWYLNWGLLIMTGVLAVLGFFVMQWAFNTHRASGGPRQQFETLPEEA
jgi:amino acid transporter